jgi:CRISPR/Cas system-associated endoribonuclease Cas2
MVDDVICATSVEQKKRRLTKTNAEQWNVVPIRVLNKLMRTIFLGPPLGRLQLPPRITILKKSYLQRRQKSTVALSVTAIETAKSQSRVASVLAIPNVFVNIYITPQECRQEQGASGEPAGFFPAGRDAGGRRRTGRGRGVQSRFRRARHHARNRRGATGRLRRTPAAVAKKNPKPDPAAIAAHDAGPAWGNVRLRRCRERYTATPRSFQVTIFFL